jgi:hypothetical protein
MCLYASILPTIQLLSICLYSITQSTSFSKACFLTHDLILVCMLIFNQQFSQHGSIWEMFYVLIKDTSYRDCHCLSVLILFTHTSWTNNLKYASEIITYHTWPPSTNLMTYNLCTWNWLRKVKTSVWGEWVSQSVLQDTCTQSITILATYT